MVDIIDLAYTMCWATAVDLTVTGLHKASLRGAGKFVAPPGLPPEKWSSLK
jgi:hypothetical protein